MGLAASLQPLNSPARFTLEAPGAEWLNVTAHWPPAAAPATGVAVMHAAIADAATNTRSHAQNLSPSAVIATLPPTAAPTAAGVEYRREPRAGSTSSAADSGAKELG